MTDELVTNNPQLSRRRVLRTVSGLTALGVSSVVTSSSVGAGPGDQQWAFETGSWVEPSPTVVDGTVFVGSDDANLYAVDADVSGSSEGSRARLGTLGHHGDWAYADQQEPSSDGLIPSVGAVSPPTLIVAGGLVGAGMYAWRRSQQAGEDTTTSNPPSGSATDTTTSNPPSDSATEESATGDVTGDSDPQERATDLLTQAEEAETDGAYQQAADAYEEAISQFEQAIAGSNDDEESKAALKAEIEEITTSREAVTAVIEARKSIKTTLQAAERSFKEAIARYAADEQTVARIRFRQARDAFEEAQQVVDHSDTEVLAQPIEVSFEQEATLPSVALEDLAVLDESTVGTLAAVDIESITNLEADPENEAITPTVVNDLEESDEIGGEEAALLSILSWWYEGDSREFVSEGELSQRYKQADYGFDQST